jgi:hypothetical protein
MRLPEAAEASMTTMPKRLHAEMSVVDEVTLARLRQQLRRQSKECVIETLGISSNTWTKMKRGEAVRRDLVERAVQRISMTEMA